MLSNYLNLCKRLGTKGNSYGQYYILRHYYARPDRKYHTFEHIKDCLRKLDLIRNINLVENPNEVELAIWFHDAVYETWASDNEKRSAQLATFFITKLMGLSENLADRVAGLILATRHINILNLSNDEKVIVDIDLSSLGESPEIFSRNNQNIRREYFWIPDILFNLRRKEIFKRFLNRRSIYRTEFFRDIYEKQARLDLKKEIDRFTK